MSGDRIAALAADILAEARNFPRVKAASKAERESWARAQAEQRLATVPYLPMGLSWSVIEAAYMGLAGTTPVYPHRRRRPSNRRAPRRRLA